MKSISRISDINYPDGIKEINRLDRIESKLSRWDERINHPDGIESKSSRWNK